MIYKKGDKFLIDHKYKQSNYITLKDIKEVEVYKDELDPKYPLISLTIVEGSAYSKLYSSHYRTGDVIYLNRKVLIPKKDKLSPKNDIW